MLCAGIDIGSRTIEVVLIEQGAVVETRQGVFGFDPLKEAMRLLNGLKPERLMATGYGRHLLEVALDAPTVTEIKAYATGGAFLFPEIKTILDIGGQDSKAIALNGAGKVLKFEMNDRCAAGTGKFLEVMAQTLGYNLDQFGQEALQAPDEIQISSMCTVFAESEVTSLLAKGKDRGQIAKGLHRSVVKRAVGMLKRVSVVEPLLFAGGVAQNPCMVQMIEEGTREPPSWCLRRLRWWGPSARPLWRRKCEAGLP